MNETIREKGYLVLFNEICSKTRHGICLLENAASSTTKEMKSAMVIFVKVLTIHKEHFSSFKNTDNAFLLGNLCNFQNSHPYNPEGKFIQHF